MENSHELQTILQQLEQNSRKQARYARWQCIFSLLAALCCGGLLMVVLTLLPQVNQVVEQAGVAAAQAGEIARQAKGLADQAEAVLTNLETVTQDLAGADLAGMVENVDDLVVSSQDGVAQALEKINTMDIEALNKAIGNLSAVVEPMAKFFKVFK